MFTDLTTEVPQRAVCVRWRSITDPDGVVEALHHASMYEDRIAVVSGEVCGRHLHLLLLERDQDHDVAQEVVLLLMLARCGHASIIFSRSIAFYFFCHFSFLLLHQHSHVLPFKCIIEIFNFLLYGLQLVSFLLQHVLHLGKCSAIYLHLKTPNCECIPTHRAPTTAHALATTLVTLCSLSTFVLRKRQNLSQTAGLKHFGVFSGASSSSMACSRSASSSGCGEPHGWGSLETLV